MINVQEFNLDVIKEYKCFYLLKNISNISEIEILHNTPSGYVEKDTCSAFYMPNGRIIIAWKDPLHFAPMHNFIARNGSVDEVINSAVLERIIDIYNKPVNSSSGMFIFSNSEPVVDSNTEWRCDSTRFGPSRFPDALRVDVQLSDIVVYEPIFSINGVGHIIYIESKSHQSIAQGYMSNGSIPTSGRTIWEVLKLINEWSIVNQEPFNNNEDIAKKAYNFIKGLKLSEEELEIINSQVPMQISNYILGNQNARQRPENILEINESIKKIVFSRVASCSLSALEYMNPGMWNIEELLSYEINQLDIDKKKLEIFKQKNNVSALAVSTQNNIFLKKQEIFNKISNNEL